MTVMLPTLFALTGLACISAIWRAWDSNRALIADLHRQVKHGQFGGDIVVNLREPTTDFDAMFALRRARQIRVASPKPVTHRLHHFGKPRSVA